jgi:5,10-methylenetetrahydromethanopterin reductase
MSNRVGVFADASGHVVQSAIDRARLAEELGLDSVWVSQAPDSEDCGVLVAAQASATQRIRLGTAIMSIYTRHPTAAVQLAGTLDALSNGRFTLGLGIGHQLTVDWMLGIPQGSPLTALREYVSILRAALADGLVHIEGQRFTARWRYNGPRRADMPILVGGVGPRILELAGEIADAAMVWLSTPRYVEEHAVPHLLAGLERGGRGARGFEIAAPVYVAVTRHPEVARDRMREILGTFSYVPAFERVLATSGFEREVRERRFSDATIDEFGGFGSEEAVRTMVERYRAAGCTLPVLIPLRVPEGEAAVRSALEAAMG